MALEASPQGHTLSTWYAHDRIEAGVAGGNDGVHGVNAIVPRIYWFYLYLFTPVPHWSATE